MYFAHQTGQIELNAMFVTATATPGSRNKTCIQLNILTILDRSIFAPCSLEMKTWNWKRQWEWTSEQSIYVFSAVNSHVSVSPCLQISNSDLAKQYLQFSFPSVHIHYTVVGSHFEFKTRIHFTHSANGAWKRQEWLIEMQNASVMLTSMSFSVLNLVCVFHTHTPSGLIMWCIDMSAPGIPFEI